MNYLALCQRLVQEAPITGTGPASVKGQVAGLKQVVDWVNTACMDIQSLHKAWRFMVGEFAFNTIAGQSTYNAEDVGYTDLETWGTDVVATSNMDHRLAFVPWSPFKVSYQIGAIRDQKGSPTTYSIKPDNSLIFWPTPEKVYAVRGEYQKEAIPLIEDDDEPPFPKNYHMAVVWSALMMYCAYTSIPDLYAQSEIKYRSLIRKMEIEQMPRVLYGEPLA